MTAPCTHVREHLGAYVDGELTGTDRLLVTQHVADCDVCADQLTELRAIGDLLRERAAACPAPPELGGLAAGVVSRARAEESQSWTAMFHRAAEDWHWALVGAGSVCAAVLSVLAVSVICVLGPGGERADSLAAMLNNLEAPSGTLWLLATPIGRDQVPTLMRLDRGGSASEWALDPVVLPAGFSGPSGSDLASALSQMVVRADGRANDLRSMSRLDRQHTEVILGETRRLRAVPTASWGGRFVNVQSVQGVAFVTNTRVKGKAL